MDASLITTSGSLKISSKDDPRHNESAPIFPEMSLVYNGRMVSFPTTLLDAVITITPGIPGYLSNSIRCIYLGGILQPGCSQVNLPIADMVEGEWRVVLKWGENPRALDLHCFTNFNLDHIFFCNKNNGGRNNEMMGCIELDVDVREGNGPETLTFTPGVSKKVMVQRH
jgi:uncharacterized protein YfaP (DUF2135 family)